VSEKKRKISLHQATDPDNYRRIIERAEENQSSHTPNPVGDQGSSPHSLINDHPGAVMPPVDWPIERKLLHGKIIAAIKTVFDPEIPVDIYELGLIYHIDISPDLSVTIRMTLTAPNCPVADSLPRDVESKVENIPEVVKATAVIVWEPPWTRDRMSEAARLSLGFF